MSTPTPEEIRAMYDEVDAASDGEAQTIQAEAMANPETAKHLLLTLFAVAPMEPAYRDLEYSLFRQILIARLQQEIEHDPQAAIRYATILVELMQERERLTKKANPHHRHKRGEKTVRSA